MYLKKKKVNLHVTETVVVNVKSTQLEEKKAGEYIIS